MTTQRKHLQDKVSMNKEFVIEGVALEELFEVLENQTTLDSVRKVLKEAGEAHSASSWKSMIETRLKPHILDGRLAASDLISLIQVAEEHSTKHVLLFKYDTSKLDDLLPLFDEAKIYSWAKNRSYPLKGEYRFAAKPKNPIVSEVRIDRKNGGSAFSIKISRTLTKTKRHGEPILLEDGLVVVGKQIEYRAVDLLKIYENGVIEARIHARRNVVSYPAIAETLFKLLDEIIDRSMITEISLSPAKKFISDVKNSDVVSEKFHVFEAGFRNSFGDRLHSSALQESGGIHASKVMPRVISQFSDSGNDSHCDRGRVGYIYNGTKTINVILTEGINEIILTAHLTQDEFDSTIDAILKICE